MYLNNMTIEEIKSKGFPYLNFDEDYIKRFNTLCNINMDNYIKKDKEKSFIKTSGNYSKLANVFFPHMFNTKVTGMKTPLEAFNNDKLLTRAVALSKKFSKNPTLNTLRSKLMVVSGTQCVSNFRPDVAMYIYNKYGNNGDIYDPSMGYGGRLIGFLASNCKSYTGTDVNTENNSGYNNILTHYNKNNKKVTIYNTPAEELILSNQFDLCFTSPPYFCKEVYSDAETQSCNKYTSYESWIENFLKKMLINCFNMTKPNGYIVINIQDVTVKNKTYSLVHPTEAILKDLGCVQEETLGYSLKKTIGNRQKYNTETDYKYEPILIFKKV